MGRLKQKGKAGAAKAYVTRTAAVKKLQCSLADFRRLCILKGIFPREPRHKKRANKGNSAPTSFYYAKDIAYLQHEPVLKKLREHKAFAKKLSRALGRGEWSTAKSLEDNKPVYRLDHIIKERYNTFVDALRDIDDALCLISLFASLPANERIPSSLVENCARLSNEWQLYVMNTHSLRKVFLSIKGIYYQAEVHGEKITWIVPYQFTQTIPSDVDVRVMLTFLELYQTLLGFVFFKLYTDEGWTYPPPMDASKDEAAAGVGAFSLQEVSRNQPETTTNVPSKHVSGKDIRQAIKEIDASTTAVPVDQPLIVSDKMEVDEEDFVAQPSKSEPNLPPTELPTLKTITQSVGSTGIVATLFSGLTFYLSRETPRPLLEFTLRSFGGRVGWPSSSGAGSPFDESDASITHVIIDRPAIPGQPVVTTVQQADLENESEESRARKRHRKYVQPQWVVDCINAGKILSEDRYERGKVLPPHLSPFGEAKGAYDPAEEALAAQDEEMVDDEDEESDVEDAEGDLEDDEDLPANLGKDALRRMKTGIKQADEAAIRAAELDAEAAGVDVSQFEKTLAQGEKDSKKKKSSKASAEPTEAEMNKMLMSNKQRKLYEKMKYSEKKREDEKMLLQAKKQAIEKAKKKQARK